MDIRILIEFRNSKKSFWGDEWDSLIAESERTLSILVDKDVDIRRKVEALRSADFVAYLKDAESKGDHMHSNAVELVNFEIKWLRAQIAAFKSVRPALDGLQACVAEISEAQK